MNQKEFFKKIRNLNLPCDSYYILGGGALLLYGIRKKTADVELCISPTLFKCLVKEGRIDPNAKDKNGFYRLIDESDVEVVVNEKKDFKCVTMGGDIMLEDIRQILEYKKKRNKKKDKKDIEEIQKFLKKYPNYPKF